MLTKTLKLTIVLALLAVLAAAQNSTFKITISRWSTEWPAPISGALPAAPNPAAGASVAVQIDHDLVLDAALITLHYEKDGKRLRQWQIAFPARFGCSPEPCQFAVAHFNVGNIDVSKARAEVRALIWYSEEEEE